MTELGPLLPTLGTPPPGPASRALAERLRRVESRNVTWLGDDFPVFWEEARGANVRDADGNVYLDWTAAFGVALAGHRAPAITAAMERQADRLVHGMGDVHPTAIRVELLERLAALMPWPSTRGVLASSGSEAVEIALKTAHLATGRPGILVFEGGYHGLTLGALAATARPYFREPFEARLYGGIARVPFPEEGGEAAVLDAVDHALRYGAPDGAPIGAVIVEPVQARGGVRVLPAAFGAELTELTRRHGAVLVADEVFTGLGRCGAILASGRVGLEPDLVCLGKVLGGGLPLSACLGPADVLDAWPASPGEALHTSTFLGHPLACATALAVIDDLEGGLVARVEEAGARLRRVLADALEEQGGLSPLRGLGLLLGVEVMDSRGAPLPGAGARAAEAALAEGLLVLPAGDEGSVVEITPPACLTPEQEGFGAAALARALAASVLALALALALLLAPAPAAAQIDLDGPVGDDGGGARLPVLLVPGWGDEADELEALFRRFLEAGWDSLSLLPLSFEDPVGSNREHAREVARAVDSLRARTGAERVDVVAHSMGGLAVRYWLQHGGAAEVRRVVFIATPHRGTFSALVAWGEGSEEMMPGSVFLSALERLRATPDGVEALTVRTPMDLHVLPQESALLPGVPDVEVCCPTHAGLLDDAKAFRAIRRFLRRGS